METYKDYRGIAIHTTEDGCYRIYINDWGWFYNYELDNVKHMIDIHLEPEED